MTRKVEYARPTLIILSVLVLAFLGSYNQPYYPVTWFDEGLALQGAMNLATYDQYAMRSAEGFRVLDQPLIANGPGLAIPISVVFRFWGVGLLQARALMVFYFVATALVFFQVSSRFYGKLPALISAFLLLAIPEEGFVFYGRQALGNVPALLYFLIGFLSFLALGRIKKFRFAVLSGLFFGLALVTKGQYWIFVPILALIIVADLVYYKQIGLGYTMSVLLVTLTCAFVWLFVQYTILGSENFKSHVAAINSSAKVTIIAFRSMRIPGNIWYLIRSGFPFFVLPGLAFAFWDSRQQTLLGLGRFMLVAFVGTWIGWYVFASVGWHRYAFEAYSIGMVFAGQFFVQIFSILRGNHFGSPASLPLTGRFYVNVGLTVALVLLTAWAGVRFFKQLQNIYGGVDTSPQLLAEYIKQNIPAGAVIESWEWEMDALTPEHTYHHPTNDWVDRETAETQFGETINQSYDPLIYHPEYLLMGPFSTWTGIYSDFLSNGCCAHIVTVGGYTLYQIHIHDE